MKTIMLPRGLALLALVLVLIPGCSSEDAVMDPDPPGNGNLPPVPVPGSTSELLPATSDNIAVGLSNEIGEFTPQVQRIRVMLDDSTLVWVDMNRRLILACDDGLPENTCDAAAANRSYIGASPRLLHERFWRKIKQVTLDPGATNYQYEETITSGTSTSHEHSREFSQTMGIEVSVGGSWGPFSASVTASYEQTTTEAEVHTVSFSEETSVTETFSVTADPTRTTVYAIWQLVDMFTLVDADTVRIHESDTLWHAEIPEVVSITFPSQDTMYQSLTYFD